MKNQHKRRPFSIYIVNLLYFFDKYLAAIIQQKANFPLLNIYISYNKKNHRFYQLYIAGEKIKDVEIVLEAINGLTLNSGEADDFVRLVGNIPEINGYAATLCMVKNRTKKTQFEYFQNKTALYLLNHSINFIENGYSIRSHNKIKLLELAKWKVICFTRPGYPVNLSSPLSLSMGRKSNNDVKYHTIEEPTESNKYVFDYIYQSYLSIKELISKESPGIVIAASNFVCAAPAMMAAHYHKIPFIYDVRGFWEETAVTNGILDVESIDYLYIKAIEIHMYESASKIFTLSNIMAEKILHDQCKRENIVIIPNMISERTFFPIEKSGNLEESYGISNRDIVIGYVGSTSKYEGLNYIVRAAEKIKEKYDNVKFIISGELNDDIYSDLDKLNLTDYVIKNGIQSEIIFTGHIDHGDIKNMYSLFDIAVYPRISTPVTELVPPLKPIESMAMGIPVILSSVGGMSELAEHGSSGLYFEAGNLDDLVCHIETLIKSPDMRRTIGEKARESVLNNRIWERAGLSIINKVLP